MKVEILRCDGDHECGLAAEIDLTLLVDDLDGEIPIRVRVWREYIVGKDCPIHLEVLDNTTSLIKAELGLK